MSSGRCKQHMQRPDDSLVSIWLEKDTDIV